MMANALVELDQEEAAAVMTSNEKRIYQGSAAGIPPRDGSKRPRITLFSVVMEAIKLDSLQKKILPNLEPLLRKVVKEELDYALSSTNFFPTRVETCNERILQLVFKNKLSQTLFTGSKVEAEDGTPIQVQLLDAKTRELVSSGPEATARLEIVALDGDFAAAATSSSETAAAADEEGKLKTSYWEQSDFEHYTLKEREGKRPLLTGDLSVCLKEGEASLGEFQFTDNSSWIRSRKFCLGIKVAPGYCQGIRIREAKTDRFIVKDHRGESYKKHYPPSLEDEVWRLDKIGKDGAFHKRLSQANIFTVEDFLRFHSMQPEKLRKILGNGMSTKVWDATVEHAQTCPSGSKQHIYIHQNGLSIIFNNIFQWVAIKENSQSEHRAADSLHHKEKATVEKLVKALANGNWKDLIHEYDGERSLDVNPSLQGDGSMAGSNAGYMQQEENHLVSQSYATQEAASGLQSSLPDQRNYMMDSSRSSLNDNEFSQQQPLLAASCLYPAQMQGYITNGMPNWVPTPSLHTAMIPPPPCSLALPPEPASSGAISSIHPEAIQWQSCHHPCQDLSKWSAANCSEGATQELEVEMMHPGNMSTYLPTYNTSWQDVNNNTSAYGFNTTSSCIISGEFIPHTTTNGGEQPPQRIKLPAPPWGTSKPPRAGVRQV
ncbi:unnamed protein product [Sphagnum troendelagicum]|uniref:Calmodulin-binding protein n=1 Tax=Sphagnum troendelagicum TaxID=128251 RepID=A0ABP0U252_9BRYO